MTCFIKVGQNIYGIPKLFKTIHFCVLIQNFDHTTIFIQRFLQNLKIADVTVRKTPLSKSEYFTPIML